MWFWYILDVYLALRKFLFMLRLWEVYCAGNRQTYLLLSLCISAPNAPNGSDARSCCQVSYFEVQDVVKIIQERFPLRQVWPQEKAGAVARYVRLYAADEQE